MGHSLWAHPGERLLTDAKALKHLNSAIRAGDKTFQETISTCDVKLHWDFLAVLLHALGTVIQLQIHSRSYKRATVLCLIRGLYVCIGAWLKYSTHSPNRSN